MDVVCGTDLSPDSRRAAETAGAVAAVALCSVLVFREPFLWTTGVGILLVMAGVALITARVA